MIKNERQYKITKTQAEKFAKAIAALAEKKSADPLLSQLEKDALRSQLGELQQEITEYEKLRDGSQAIVEVSSFDELAVALVKARIVAGLSQKELAERLEMKEQQIQRYESTEYRTASFGRLQEIVNALGVKVRKEVLLPTPNANATALFKRLKSAGINRQFALERLLPPAIAERMKSTEPKPTEVEVLEAATTIGKVYDWEKEDIFGGETLHLPREAAGLARFKLPSKSDERKLSAYTVYAHYLALLVLKVTEHIEQYEVPTDAEDFRADVLEEFGSVTFPNVLAYVWGLGIPVLPLHDSGAFHGACWRSGGRDVIVLKQKNMSLDRWLNDLIHEAYHAGQEPDAEERTVVEAPETSEERRNDPEEQEATSFSGDVMLDGRAEELAQMCVSVAGGRIARLKSAVPKIAAAEDVEVGALANYLAYRLSFSGHNWWGTASNLQSTDVDPWEIARDQLMKNWNLDQLNELDQQLLTQALTIQKGS